MRKLLLVSAFSLLALSTFAQVDKAMLEAKKKEKEKSDKAITDPKAMAKPATWLDRAKLYEEMARNQAYASLDSNSAMVAYDALKKAIELDAAKPSKVTKEAQNILNGEKNDAGIDLAVGFVSQGAQKFQNKKYEEALKFFNVAQEINKKDTLAPLYGAYSAMQMQKNGIAAEMLESYIVKGGKDASNFSLLSQVYQVEKQNDKAMQVLEKAMQIFPAQKTAFKAERVNILLNSQQYEAAKSALQELIELDPSKADYALNLGIINDNEASQYNAEIRKLRDSGKKIGNYEKTLKDAQETEKVFLEEVKRINGLIAKQPKNADLKRQKADVEAKIKENKGAMEKATADLAKAKEEAAQAGDASAKIAEKTAKLNKSREAAKVAYTKALSIDPNNYDALFNMGVFYFNEAVEMKAEIDAMDMKDYNAKGKELESKVCGKFKQAQPYFIKAKAIRQEEQAVEILKNIDNLVKQFEEKKVPCEEAK